MVIGVVVLLGAKPAKAHHAFAATFDTSKPVTVKGVITKVELINPHSWFWMDVTSPDGAVVNVRRRQPKLPDPPWGDQEYGTGRNRADGSGLSIQSV